MTQPGRPLVVIGLGSTLRSDDAVGIRVVEALRERADREPWTLPSDTRLVDGGTRGPDLLPTIGEARGLVLVDAVRSGDPPGTVTVRRGAEIEAADHPGGAGATGAVGDLLGFARLLGWLPGEVALVGVEVAAMDIGIQLSPAVAVAVPEAVAAVRDELARMDGSAAPAPEPAWSDARLAGAVA